MADTEERFTPTEDLVLEVLIARYRLGESLWTFSSQISPTIERLASRGWVNSMHGIVEKTCRASLTSKAIAQFVSYPYIPPVARDKKKLKKEFKKIYKYAQSLKQRFKDKSDN